MRLLLRDNVYGWRMTGLLGKDAKWFFGFSRVMTEQEIEAHEHAARFPLIAVFGKWFRKMEDHD